MIRALLAFAVAFWSSTSHAEEIAIGLTTRSIEIDADFSGEKFVLFGALTGLEGDDQNAFEAAGDLAAVVIGPISAYSVRPIIKRGVIWTAGTGARIENAPSLHLTASSRDLSVFANDNLRARLGLGADFLSLRLARDPAEQEALAFIDGFITTARHTGRYREDAGKIRYIKNGLFAIDIALPPDTPVGDYAIDVFLIRNGAVISADTAALTVRKAGVEQRIYELAHTQPLGYGIMCVAMSLLAGWLAAVAFRK